MEKLEVEERRYSGKYRELSKKRENIEGDPTGNCKSTPKKIIGVDVSLFMDMWRVVGCLHTENK